MPHQPAPPGASAAHRFERLAALTASFSECVTLTKVARVVVEGAAAAADAEAATLALRGGEAARLDVVASAGFPVGDPPPRTIPLDEPSPLAAAVGTRAPVFVQPPARGEGTWAALPLTVRNRTIGALGLRFPDNVAFDDEARAFLDALARQSALAIERAQLHEMESASRAEAEEEHERFRSLVQELDAVFWESDASLGRFSFVSRRAEAILGHPVERWLREPGFWKELLHPEDREWASGFREACARDGRDHTLEYRAVAADGRTLWLRDVAYVARDASGAPSKLRGVMMDVTRERAPGDERVAREHGPLASRASGFLPVARRLLPWGGSGGAGSAGQPPSAKR